MSVSTNSPEAGASTQTTRKVLETCLVETHGSYQTLLNQPGNLDHCREAGRTVRHLAQCLAETDLVANGDDEDIEDEFLTDE